MDGRTANCPFSTAKSGDDRLQIHCFYVILSAAQTIHVSCSRKEPAQRTKEVSRPVLLQVSENHLVGTTRKGFRVTESALPPRVSGLWP